LKLTVRGLGGAVCFLRADLTGRAPYIPFRSRVARCRVSGSHRNPGLIPLTRTGLPTWQNCCWKILQEHKALFNPKTCNVIQKHHPYIRTLHSETSWDNKNAFRTCGDVQGSEQRHAVQLSEDMLKGMADISYCAKLFLRHLCSQSNLHNRVDPPSQADIQTHVVLFTVSSHTCTVQPFCLCF